MNATPTAETPSKAVAGKFAARTVTSLCQQIKGRLSLRQVSSMLGIDLPARDGVKFRSPLRPDQNPSCSIENERLTDWSRGESFDAISLYAVKKGITNRNAIFELAEHLGLKSVEDQPSQRKPSPLGSLASLVLREPSEEDFQSILTTRKLPPEGQAGLLLAYSLGVLGFTEVTRHPCWILTDSSKQCAEARRLDGKNFPVVGDIGERKAHTLKGSTKSWPVGLHLEVSESRAKHLGQIPLVLLEGGPDLLAAYCVLASLALTESDFHPVGMLGTSRDICGSALKEMSGRRVVIVAHGDEAGVAAARRRAQQLSGAACRVQLRALQHGKDLNDLVTAHGLVRAKEVLLP
jgi:hypothetical protein